MWHSPKSTAELPTEKSGMIFCYENCSDLHLLWEKMFLWSGMFSRDDTNNSLKQGQVKNNILSMLSFEPFFLKIFIEQNYKIILKSNFISCRLKVCVWMKERSLESWKVVCKQYFTKNTCVVFAAYLKEVLDL